MIEVGELILKLAAGLVGPNLTAVTPAKPVPVIVTAVPPAAEPLFGEILLIVGLTPGVPYTAMPAVVAPHDWCR